MLSRVISSIDFYRLIFYFEPNFCLLVGKLGCFKFCVENTIFYKFLGCSIFELTYSILPVLFVRLKNNSLVRQIVNLSCYPNSTIVPCSKILIGSGIDNDCSISVMKLISSFTYFKRFLLRTILSATVGWTQRLRLAGVGYKLLFSNNFLILKVGYSHYIMYLLPYDLRLNISGRKKRIIILFGLSRFILGLVVGLLLSFRLPNIYTGKGIRLRGRLFNKKAGKKSQF